jgi:hypothetical protein
MAARRTVEQVQAPQSAAAGGETATRKPVEQAAGERPAEVLRMIPWARPLQGPEITWYCAGETKLYSRLANAWGPYSLLPIGPAQA